MILIKNEKLSELSSCPYSFDESFRQKYFFAFGLTKEEMGDFIRSGWRRFGLFFFMPVCPNCSRCTPIRIDADNLTLTKNQRKIVKKNLDTIFETKYFSSCSKEDIDKLFEIYREHNLFRFQKKSTKSNFLDTFFNGNQDLLITFYIIEGDLAAFGFLDDLDDGLSSIYFCYKKQYIEYSLGFYSIIRELEYIKSKNLKYYYLGYFIEDNHFMSYKNRFKPYQLYNWKEKNWESTS